MRSRPLQAVLCPALRGVRAALGGLLRESRADSAPPGPRGRSVCSRAGRARPVNGSAASPRPRRDARHWERSGPASTPQPSGGRDCSMTAIGVQSHRPLGQRRPHWSFFESFIRTLIIVCTALAVVLSSISICDGHWLLDEDRLFGLWHFCTVTNQSRPHCLRDLSQAQVPGLAVGVGLARSVGAMAVVAAIFGLELLMVSQVCENIYSRRKWAIGSCLLLVSFILSSAGLLGFVILLRNQVTLIGFTLMFWCEFTASFLFFLNAVSGLHINSITQPGYQLKKL